MVTPKQRCRGCGAIPSNPLAARCAKCGFSLVAQYESAPPPTAEKSSFVKSSQKVSNAAHHDAGNEQRREHSRRAPSEPAPIAEPGTRESEARHDQPIGLTTPRE